MEEKITQIKPSEASKKPEDGEFFRFAWRVSEALYQADLTKVQHRLIHYIIRKTWGWNKKMFIFNLKKAAEETGLAKSHISTALKTLVEADIIKADPHDANTLGINKYVETWNLGHIKNQVERETLRRKKTVTDVVTDQGVTDAVTIVTDAVTNITDPVTETGREPALTEEHSDAYRQYIDKIINTTTPTGASEKFSEHLEVLRSVDKYPYDGDKDRLMLEKFERMYPGLDLLRELNGWSVYKLGQPIKPKDNPRGQLNTWMRKAIEGPTSNRQAPRSIKPSQQDAKARMLAWAETE